MIRPLLRAGVIGVITMLCYGGAELVHFRQFCARHLAWLRVQDNPSAVVLSDGFAVARDGDAIFTCETKHCFGIGGCHEDLACYCAPATMTADAVARALNARSCAVDQRAPSPQDDRGACRYEHCDEHVGP